jgi:hypothetical protein
VSLCGHPSRHAALTKSASVIPPHHRWESGPAARVPLTLPGRKSVLGIAHILNMAGRRAHPGPSLELDAVPHPPDECHDHQARARPCQRFELRAHPCAQTDVLTLVVYLVDCDMCADGYEQSGQQQDKSRQTGENDVQDKCDLFSARNEKQR